VAVDADLNFITVKGKREKSWRSIYHHGTVLYLYRSQEKTLPRNVEAAEKERNERSKKEARERRLEL
jgi:hypothetical protein